MKFIIKTAYPIILICLLLSCRGEIAKLKSSSRRITSEIRFYQKEAQSLIKGLGIDTAQLKELDTLSSFAPLSQKSYINKFSYLYDALNGNTVNQYLTSLEFDSTTFRYKNPRINNEKLREDVEVYTWHPYWMGDIWRNYDFNLISTISFFTYKINPETGSYLNPSELTAWRETDLLDSAKKHKTKVLLNLALEGENNLQEFLKDEVHWNTTLDSVFVLLKERDADGIEIEFIDLPADRANKFVDFVNFMKFGLGQRFLGKKITVALVLPANSAGYPVDVKKLNISTDLFIIKGMDYHEIDGTVAATAPLRNEVIGSPSLTTTLNEYLANGLIPEKSILALPLYGTQWAGNFNVEDGFYITDFERKITFSEINQVFKSRDTSYVIEPTLDELTMTKYYFMEFPDNTSVEGWYDDAFTLSKKMDFALVNNFKGVGLWAMGYDLGEPGIWDVIKEKFTGEIVYIKDPIKEIEGYPIKIAAFFHSYRKIFLVSFTLATLAIAISLAFAFTDWRFRETVLARQVYRIIVLAILISFLLGLFSFLGLLTGNSWTLILVFLLGAICSYLVERYGGMMKINKP